MDIRSELNATLKYALKNREQIKVATIRLILAALKDRDITVREKGQADGVDDESILLMLQSMIKQRNESSKIYSEAGRFDLAEREDAEIEVIRSFMPQQLGDSEIVDVIDGLIEKLGCSDIKDMGKIMGVLKSEYAGRVDMGKAGAIAKEKLG